MHRIPNAPFLSSTQLVETSKVSEARSDLLFGKAIGEGRGLSSYKVRKETKFYLIEKIV